MAHEIEDGKAFFTGAPAWHGLGTVLATAPTVEEAWKLAYPHTLFKLDMNAQTVDPETGAPLYMPVDSVKAIFRDDGKFLGSVGDGYEIVQPYKLMSQFNPLIDSGLVTLEAGGSLCGGTKMWALAKIEGADMDVLPNDQIKGYMLLAAGLCGNMRILASLTNTRVVCANTLAAAISEGIDFKIKHTASVHARLDTATSTIKKAIETFRNDAAAYKQLAVKPMSQAKQEVYVRTVIAGDGLEDLIEGAELSTRTENKVNRVIELLETQRGLDLVPAMRGTAWQAYNAVTEYITHEHGRTDDNRLNGQWFGATKKLNQQALNLALTM